MTEAEIRLLVYKYIGVDGGYLNDFSYSAHESFYPEYCDLLDIDVAAARDKYRSTAKTFLGILQNAAPCDQARIIRGTIKKFEEKYAWSDRGSKGNRELLKPRLEAIAARLEGNVVPPPTLESTSEAVQRALHDTETLLRNGDPVSGVDRVHTAFHGHLLHLCQRDDVNLPKDPTVVQIWKAIITSHPTFQVGGPRRDDIKKMLRSLSAAIDALSPVRNRASLSHPNEALLEAAEALLVVNMTRTLINYLEQKLP